jgi:putative DNA methylase
MAKERPDLKPLVGQKLTVIVYIWARTVKSPNPAFAHVEVPLAANFFLRVDAGKEVFVQPVVKGEHYSFSIKVGTPSADVKNGTKAEGRGSNFRCLVSDAPISGDYIKAEGEAGRLGAKLMAVVAEGTRGRVYLSPTAEMEGLALGAKPTWKPSGDVPARLTGGTCVPYGLKEWGDLFTSRQLVALTTLGDLVGELQNRIQSAAASCGMASEDVGLESGGGSARAYAEAIRVFLSFQIDQLTNHLSTICAWHVNNEQLKNTFARQSLPMTWDFAEVNPFSTSTGSLNNLQERQIKAFSGLATAAPGFSTQADAAIQTITRDKIISTDPPYYDNIAYADLSDFFYVWTRKNLRDVFPNLLATIAVPKAEELVATAYRHGGKEAAEDFFLKGMSKAMRQLVYQSHSGFPVTIYYAFKQSDTKGDGTSSTGWETFLDSVFRAGFLLSGTWPLRTEQTAAMKTGVNALASSIVLVCRKRPADAPSISRREFIRELNGVLPEALDEMTKGSGDERSPVAPVDLSQAIIGPGMAVFSKYSAVLEADGSPMSVRTALQLINRFLAEDDFDADTQFCLHWFEQHGWTESVFGEADVLARSKSTSVDAMKEAGVLQSGSGKVRLLKWAEYPTNWDPRTDTRTPVWEALHQLIRALKQGGESASGALLAALGGKAEAVRQLAYRLYTLCERLGQAEDARAYNELITSWTGIESAASTTPKPAQGDLFE